MASVRTGQGSPRDTAYQTRAAVLAALAANLVVAKGVGGARTGSAAPLSEAARSVADPPKKNILLLSLGRAERPTAPDRVRRAARRPGPGGACRWSCLCVSRSEPAAAQPVGVRAAQPRPGGQDRRQRGHRGGRRRRHRAGRHAAAPADRGRAVGRRGLPAHRGPAGLHRGGAGARHASLFVGTGGATAPIVRELAGPVELTGDEVRAPDGPQGVPARVPLLRRGVVRRPVRRGPAGRHPGRRAQAAVRTRRAPSPGRSAPARRRPGTASPAVRRWCGGRTTAPAG